MAASSAAARARIVLVTVASEEQGAVIARKLVEEKLAACVNAVGPIRSIYRWRDAIEDDREFLLIVKTRAELFAKLERRVRELHTYEVPEVLALKLDAGSAPYLDWLMKSTETKRAGKRAAK